MLKVYTLEVFILFFNEKLRKNVSNEIKRLKLILSEN